MKKQKPTKEQMRSSLENLQSCDELSLCKNCWCMTKPVKGKCGKCGGKK